jgi:arylsulfatase
MFRKGFGYEGSARIPLIIADSPANTDRNFRRVVDHVVELRDVMPTLLDLAGLPIPTSVDGVSLAPYLRAAQPPAQPPRPWLHGEHVTLGQSLQWITDGKTKYLWASGNGTEELFDLESDPDELTDLAADPDNAELLRLWRHRLIAALEGREEGFVQDGQLVRGQSVVTILEHIRKLLDA